MGCNMRSMMITGLDEELRYTNLLVMRSAAGWYIGSYYVNENGSKVPGTRDSDYYPTKEMAEHDLINECWNQRSHP